MRSLLHILWIWKDCARRCRGYLNATGEECERQQQQQPQLEEYNGAGTTATATVTAAAAAAAASRHFTLPHSVVVINATWGDISEWSDLQLMPLSPSSFTRTLVYHHVNSFITIRESRIAHRRPMWVPDASGKTLRFEQCNKRWQNRKTFNDAAKSLNQVLRQELVELASQRKLETRLPKK